MRIPNSCAAWEKQMRSEAPQLQMLENMYHDNCLDEAVTADFFDRVSARGAPRDAFEAQKFAFQVIAASPDSFACQGRAVPNAIFDQLFRVEEVPALRRRLPEDELRAKGINDRDLFDFASLSDEDLRSLTDEYDGPIVLGNGMDIVWVTDFQHVEPLLGDLANLLDRLGLPLWVADRCVIIAYNRIETGKTLHVPRSLDGMGWAEFDLVEDCSAEMGRTKPRTLPGRMGLPEAVHRGCMIQPNRWEMRRIA